MRHSRGWRLRVEHQTTFDYDSPARASFNEVRQSPPSTASQTTLDARVTTVPAAPQFAYRDYWGTDVVAFNVDPPHDRLTVHSVSLVDRHPQRRASQATWSEVVAAGARHVELLGETRRTRANEELVALAQALHADTPAGTVEAIADWVHRSIEYVPGVTHVRTSAIEAHRQRRGVCQDFAHLALTLLRASGIPARYVSGYLHPETQPAIGDLATGESHAWIEAWTGHWGGIDPTNGVEVGLRHVELARGRDYGDVAPLRGVYAGATGVTSTVAVNVTRLA